MPIPEAFWQGEAGKLFSETELLMVEFFLAGAVEAEGQAGAGLAFNWDVVNQGAIDYLNFYKLDTIPGITETTRKQATAMIDDWLQSGEPLPKLFEKLEPVFGANRARMIGVTEVTRTINAGKLEGWKSTGYITQKVWTTAKDELVCPICGTLDGKVVDIEGNFELGFMDAANNEALEKYLMKHGTLEYQQPPSHTNCRCGLRPVVSTEAFGDVLDDILGLG